jgi:hypothetical protein
VKVGRFVHKKVGNRALLWVTWQRNYTSSVRDANLYLHVGRIMTIFWLHFKVAFNVAQVQSRDNSIIKTITRILTAG